MNVENDLSQPSSLQIGRGTKPLGARLRWQAAFAKVLRVLGSDRRVWAVLTAVLLMDAVLLLLDVGFRKLYSHQLQVMGPYSIANDGGFGERAEYALGLVGAVASFVLAWRYRSIAASTVGALFCFTVLDNALQFHEQMGRMVQHLAPRGLPMKDNHFGEFVVMATFGAFVLAVIVPTILRHVDALHAGLFIVLAAICGAGFFGIFVDAIHGMVPGGTKLFHVFTLLEDGGELVFITLAGGIAASLVIVRHKLG